MTILDLAKRHIGIRELGADADHPLIQWWLSLCHFGPDSPDETPWCSAFVNGMAWLCGYARSENASARSWLRVGTGVPLAEARPGDVIVLKRGVEPQPGPEVLSAQGHVGLFDGFESGQIAVVSGNMGDAVTRALFRVDKVLGVRRLS